MADNSQTTFEKMGESIIGSVVNISGQRSPYTKVAGKEGFGKSGTGDLATKKNKGASLIKNANGPACKIFTTISYPNSGGENDKVGRNTKRVQGPYSFELARAQGGNSKGV